LNWKEFLPLETERQTNHGYILQSILSLLAWVSLLTMTAFETSATDIHIFQAEKNMLHNFHTAERNLMEAEKYLRQGIVRSDLAHIETFQPKHFRKRAGIQTRHYAITASSITHQNKVEIKVTLRIDEKTSPKLSQQLQTMERISWQLL
jgi:Tfp pilus assembly protein PilE